MLLDDEDCCSDMAILFCFGVCVLYSQSFNLEFLWISSIWFIIEYGEKRVELASHILIGRLIADAFSFEGLCRKAFLFGCIEPDCVMVTYLRGAHRGTGLHGHCWNNIQSCISSLIEKCAGEVGVLAAFRLGKLCHYIVDAFTFPHNSDFSGTLSEHMAYEDDLTLYLIKNKQNMRFSPNRFSF